MSNYKVITSHGAKLEAPSWLTPLWPHELPLDKWPTFCGAGRGLGDLLVPDIIQHAHVSPACFIHDIEWCIADGSESVFTQSNDRLRRNLKELVSVQITDDGELVRAYSWCDIYYGAVNSKIFGWPNYEQDEYCTDPWKNKEVREKLNRLAHATFV